MSQGVLQLQIVATGNIQHVKYLLALHCVSAHAQGCLDVDPTYLQGSYFATAPALQSGFLS